MDEGIVSQNQVMSPTCEICIESLPSDNVFNNNNQCVHPFCLDCIAKYIEAKVEENTIGNIPCPALNCKQSLNPLFCRSIISKQLFDKWCNTLCISTVLKFRHRSYCPNQCCSALVIDECEGKVESVKKVKCPNCKQYFCFKCMIPWHTGYRCEESGQLSRNDVLFGELVERKRWCRCYNCGQCLERIGGCRLIRCRCGAYSCYQCGQKSHSGTCHPYEGVNGSAPSISCHLLLLFILVLVSVPSLFLFLLHA